jgi:hypothetical protein
MIAFLNSFLIPRDCASVECPHCGAWLSTGSVNELRRATAHILRCMIGR